MNIERRNKIVELINKQGSVTNTQLINEFGISIETLRRDLDFLQKRGVIDKVYGGAVKKRYLATEPEYDSRKRVNFDEKKRIAPAVNDLINVGDSIYFDVGTTVLEVAKALDNSKNLTCFTNALRTAIELCDKDFNVVLTGGNVRKGEYAVSGSISEKTLSDFNIDKAIIGAGGITEDGITDYIVSEASIRSKMIENARTVILVADNSKFGVKALCKICPISSIDYLITDTSAPKSILKAIEQQGVKIIIVK